MSHGLSSRGEAGNAAASRRESDFEDGRVATPSNIADINVTVRNIVRITPLFKPRSARTSPRAATLR